MIQRAVAVSGPTVEDVVQRAKEAEDAGFDMIWFNDNTGADGFIALTAMALNTRKVKLATGIARAFVRSPVVTAVAAADMDQVTKGRFVLGLAGGTPRQNLNQASIFIEHPVPQMRELVAILRQCWAQTKQAPLSYEGKFYQLKLGRFARRKPYEQNIPIFLAAVREKMLQLTGEVADGLAGHPVNSVRFIKEFVEPNIGIGLARSGRKREDFQLTSWLLTSISNDRAQARREAAGSIANYLSTRSYSHIADSQGWTKQRIAIQEAFHVKKDPVAMVDAVTDDMIDAMSLSGTKDEVIKRFKEWKDVIQFPSFQAPGFTADPIRRKEMQDSIFEVFGAQ